MANFQGSCLCQNIRYAIVGEARGFFLCHCSRCRKVTGSAHGANILTKLESLTWLSGEERIARFQLQGTRFAKNFCPTCSSALPGLLPQGFAIVPAGSLDSEFDMKPSAHICWDSRAKWDEGFAGILCYPGLPPPA